MAITKDEILQRDNEGKLLPVSVSLISIGGEIVVTPMSRGEILSFRSKYITKIEDAYNVDDDIIEKHLVLPKLSKEEIRSLSPKVAQDIIYTIFDVSGLEKQRFSDAVELAEDDIKKSSETKKKENSPDSSIKKDTTSSPSP